MIKLSDEIEKYSKGVIAPVLVEYVKWVIDEAEKKNIKKLYFLARDGYILKEIADKYCMKYDLRIENRYLYCSRFSLRTAGYWILDEEELFSILFVKSYKTSLDIVMQRGNLNDKQRKQICNELGLASSENELAENELNELIKKLKASKIYLEAVKKNSRENFENIIGYFIQEKLFQDDEVSIVDSGWSGTMQRSLRQILERFGYKGSITGFYFGMYNSPKSPRDGKYLTYYFNQKGRICDKVKFNNNIFECMLAAPHGMTKGYRKDQNKYVPILADELNTRMNEIIMCKNYNIIKGVDEIFEKQKHFNTYDYKASRNICKKILHRCMIKPQKGEIEVFKEFLFCDDSTEAYEMEVIGDTSTEALGTHLLKNRILKKVFHIESKTPYVPYVWYYAALMSLPVRLQIWYRWNEYFWEFLRLKVKK